VESKKGTINRKDRINENYCVLYASFALALRLSALAGQSPALLTAGIHFRYFCFCYFVWANLSTEEKPMMYETFEETVDPGHTSLLVTDVQNDFCKDEPRQAMIPRIGRIVEAARKYGVQVVYIQNTVLPDGLSDAPSDLMRRRKLGINTEVTIEGSWGHQIVDPLKPAAKEPVVRKHRLSAFIGTTLDIMLRSKGIETVVVTGTATHGCVINTAYGAIAHNYYVVVVEDGVASWRKDLHDSALFLMRNTINYVVDTDQLIAAWQSRSKATGTAAGSASTNPA
jgi:ureidoacrylate peracid hydrolase